MSGALGIIGAGASVAASGTSSVFSMFYGTANSQLGYLELDVLVTENLSLPSDVTKYPIEDGSQISDHITEGAEELTITGSISSGSAWGLEFAFCKSRLIDAVDVMRNMHKDRKLVKVVTGLGTYEDMGFTALSFNRGAGEKGGNWIDINASLRKVKKVKLKQTELPPDQTSGDGTGKTGATEKKTGQSGTQNNPPKNESLAHKAATSSLGKKLIEGAKGIFQ